MKRTVLTTIALLASLFTLAQAPGTAPVTISTETQMLNGRKYFVHIVTKGQTVYSISKAYGLKSYDAVTHKDIHYLEPGDTVWLPCRGQQPGIATEQTDSKPTPAPVYTGSRNSAGNASSGSRPKPATNRATKPKYVDQNMIRVGLIMPLYLDQIESISTSKFDVEQRGKRSYKQFEFIEFYEGIMLALNQLAEQGCKVELTVADVSDGTAASVDKAFEKYNLGGNDVVIALLMRDAFAEAATLANQAGVHIVNPMATRSEITTANPYVVKCTPSLRGRVKAMLSNISKEYHGKHLYIIHSGAKGEKETLDEIKSQLDSRGDIAYTIFNWSQNAKLASTLKATPGSVVLSIYDQDRNKNRIYVSSLLNKLCAFKKDQPTLYTFNDWTHDYADVDYSQLQHLNYHTFYTDWDMSNPVHSDFLAAYREAYKSEPTSQFAAMGNDIVLYIVGGLRRHGADFWIDPGAPVHGMLQPIRLTRTDNTSGYENSTAILYRMSDLQMIQAVNHDKQ
ncbi:MAG: ABC transporter substrate-binding protein [Bacteroidales bacterium]|nr:ABC transporter substrate-binding protein [Bacteroidales bacterium]